MPTKRPKKLETREWRVPIIKKKLEHVGLVQAADKASAELLAVSEFQLRDHEQRGV